MINDLWCKQINLKSVFYGVGESITIGPRFRRCVQIERSTSLLPRWPRFRPRWLALVDNAVNLVEKCLVLMQNTSLSYFSTSFLLFNLVFNEVTNYLPSYRRGYLVFNEVTTFSTSFYASFYDLCLVLCSMPHFMPRFMPRFNLFRLIRRYITR